MSAFVHTYILAEVQPDMIWNVCTHRDKQLPIDRQTDRQNSSHRDLIASSLPMSLNNDDLRFRAVVLVNCSFQLDHGSDLKVFMDM